MYLVDAAGDWVSLVYVGAGRFLVCESLVCEVRELPRDVLTSAGMTGDRIWSDDDIGIGSILVR